MGLWQRTHDISNESTNSNCRFATAIGYKRFQNLVVFTETKLWQPTHQSLIFNYICTGPIHVGVVPFSVKIIFVAHGRARF